MNKITLSLFNEKNEIVKTNSDTYDTYLGFKRAFAMGDYFQIEVDHAPCYVVVQLDPALSPALLYLKEKIWNYKVFFDLQREWPYSKGVFSNRFSYAKARFANPEEISMHQNLAVNSHDQHHYSNGFPHAWANAETRNLTVFWAKNAIDGYLENHGHGNFPFQSWGIDGRDDAELTIDFGRNVKIDGIGIVLRADYPHDTYWKEATLKFSDGSEQKLTLEKTDKRQKFSINPVITDSLTFTKLIKDPSSEAFPALTELEAYGFNIID